MAYTPEDISPEYQLLTGITWPTAVSNTVRIKYSLLFRDDVSSQARQAVTDAITLVDDNYPGWNYALAGNVSGGWGASAFVAAVAGDTPELLIYVRGGSTSDPRVTSKARVHIGSSAGIVNTGEAGIIELSGSLFKSTDSAERNEIFWHAMRALGVILGLGAASDDRDIMYPIYRGDDDSFGANIAVSQANIDAVAQVFDWIGGAVAIPSVGFVKVGSIADPSVPTTPGQMTLSVDKTKFIQGTGVGVTVNAVQNDGTTDLPNAVATVHLETPSTVDAEYTGITDASGDAKFSISVGHALGIGTYTLTARVAKSGLEIYSAETTLTVEV